MQKLSYIPERYPYGDCFLNTCIFYLKRNNIRYEAAFLNSWGFNYSYVKNTLKFLGNNESITTDFFKKLLGAKRTVKFKNNFVEKKIFEYIDGYLANDIPPIIIIDGFYDSATDYAEVFQKRHDAGHGRFITGIDKENKKLFYVATDPADPMGEFSMTFSDLSKAFKGILHFDISEKTIDKKRIIMSLKNILSKKYYNTVFNRIRECADLLAKEIHDSEYYTVTLKERIGRVALIFRNRNKFREHILYLFEGALDKNLSRWIENYNHVCTKWSLVEGLFLKQQLTHDESLTSKIIKHMHDISSQEKKLHISLLQILKQR